MANFKNIFNGLRKNINHQDKKTGDTRLHVATRQGNTSEVKKLLAKGADPNICNHRGMAPLHLAAYWGEHLIVKRLLSSGGNPNADNGRGWTPLHSAALAGGMRVRHKSINLLLEAGARDDVKDKYDWTARQYMELWIEDEKAAAQLQKILIEDEKKEASQGNKNIPKAPRHGGI